MALAGKTCVRGESVMIQWVLHLETPYRSDRWPKVNWALVENDVESRRSHSPRLSSMHPNALILGVGRLIKCGPMRQDRLV